MTLKFVVGNWPPSPLTALSKPLWQPSLNQKRGSFQTRSACASGWIPAQNQQFILLDQKTSSLLKAQQTTHKVENKQNKLIISKYPTIHGPQNTHAPQINVLAWGKTCKPNTCHKTLVKSKTRVGVLIFFRFRCKNTGSPCNIWWRLHSIVVKMSGGREGEREREREREFKKYWHNPSLLAQTNPVTTENS